MDFRAVGWDAVDWATVRQLTVVPYGDDVDGWILARIDGRFVLPAGPVLPGEDPGRDTVLRLPMQTIGFRRQSFHPFAMAGDHLALWARGARYRGTAPHAEVGWWTGPTAEAAELLVGQGDGQLSRLVLWAEENRNSLTDEDFYALNERHLEPVYLAAATPQAGSGFSGSAEDWRARRSMICDALESDCSFLDVGCANGFLMESVIEWSAEKGISVEPYGMDLSAGLVDEARRRLPQWADRIWVGNAIEWIPPSGLRFDAVHTLLDCVPDHARSTLIAHLLDVAVADDGRLILSSYTDIRDVRLHAATIVSDLGYSISGQTRPAVRGGVTGAPSVWIDKAPS